MAKKCIPLFDMEDSLYLSEKMVKACEEWGCFRMVNHGIPLELMAEMKAVTRSLMDLPMQTKLKNSHPEPGKGYNPPNIVTPYFESLSLYDMASPRAIDQFCSQVDVLPHQG